MAGRDIDTAQRGGISEMEEAFQRGDVPALAPMGGAVSILEMRQPVGAQKVAQLRNEAEILKKIRVYAQAAGDDFYYRWEVNNRRENRKDVVEGPSIKAALTVARLFGNCETNIRVKDEGNHWIFYARFYDVETGYVLERAFQQRKGQQTGMKDQDRQLDIVFQIGQSKAIRNVICNALSPFTEFALQEAKQAIVDKIGKDVEGYRKKLIARFAELKIDIKRPELALGKPVEKWFAPDMARLIAEIQTVNDGMSDPDDVWPNPQPGARPTDPDAGGKKVEAPKDQAKPAETKPTETKAAAAAAKTGEAEIPESLRRAQPEKKQAAATDLIAVDVGAAIKVAENSDGPQLEQLDDQMSTLCDRNNREDLRKAWNEAYVARKAALRAAKAQSDAPPAASSEPEISDMDIYFNEAMADLKNVTSMDALDALEEKVMNELADEDKASAWKSACNTKARALARGR
jgi:hypothetical protein